MHVLDLPVGEFLSDAVLEPGDAIEHGLELFLHRGLELDVEHVIYSSEPALLLLAAPPSTPPRSALAEHLVLVLS